MMEVMCTSVNQIFIKSAEYFHNPHLRIRVTSCCVANLSRVTTPVTNK